MNLKIEKNGICTVKGFRIVGKSAGIKKSGKKDLALIYSEDLCNAAAVYTKNNVKGAPVYVTKDHLKDGKAQAIVINSGISNVCTGKKGIEDAYLVAELAAKELSIKKEDVLVASTGVIGAYLPMDKIKNGIKNIKKELNETSDDAAEAILTTDKAKKQVAVKIGNVTIGAIAKGSGMIHPNMATMLAFIATDAEIGSEKLKEMLSNSVSKSFNMISVDTDTSTSDMVILMANGSAGEVDEKEFQKALDFVCVELAKKIAKDGEGATKLIEVHVKNAKTGDDAKKIAKSIICSNLVKSAIFGNDPNWGRIMCAIGYSGAEIEESKIDISFGDEKIAENGTEKNFDNKKIKGLMSKDELKITINLNNGNHSATAYGCDLTYDYVKINADYHT